MTRNSNPFSLLGVTGMALMFGLAAGGCAKQGANDQGGSRAEEKPAASDTGEAPARGAASGSMVALQTGSGEIQAYVARPEGSGVFPGIVLAHEWWGLNPQIKTVADRLAGMGYVVIVPDLYHGHVAEDPEKAHELSRGLDDKGAVSDLRSGALYLRGSELVAGHPVGVMGFCMGGRLALLTALSGEPVQATVMFYGPPVTEPEELAKLSGPLLGLFGGADEGIKPETVKLFEENLKAAGKTADIRIYENAGHAFMNDSRPSYQPEAARDAWTRVESFLASHLKS